MGTRMRWGILGTGNIARKFAEGLRALDECTLQAVGSRSGDGAEKFGQAFDIPHRHGTYEALAADPEVDAVYVATPHVYHMANTLLCLEHGKHVLCEKPMGINAKQAGQSIAAARARNRFLMEAMWTQTFPAMGKARELLAGGAVGEVRMVRANFCFRGGWKPEGRLLNPALGGGSLLDVGVYPIALSHMVFGRDPARVTALPHIGQTGVDEQAGIILGYDDGALAVLTCAVRTSAPQDALIVGTEGQIEIPPMFWQPDRIVLRKGGESREFAFERLGNGYSFEAREVARCVGAGRLESDVVPWERTLSVLRTADKIRAEWGLVYPMESHPDGTASRSATPAKG